MLSLHTITNKPWSGAECIRQYAKYRHHATAPIQGVTFWRYNFADDPPEKLGQMARDHGLAVTGLARGGFFPAATPEARRVALEDNRQAIAEAHACGAPVLVLVCGAVPGIPLRDARKMIAEGIHALLPEARAAGVRLGIEPLHPMYAGERSAIVTTGQANDVCDALGSPPEVGVALDVYHTWWDPNLYAEIKRTAAASRLFSYHICDWRCPTEDLLNDRGLMGEGCIPIREITDQVQAAGFTGLHEVEIFSNRYWAMDQAQYLEQIVTAAAATLATAR